MMTCTVDGPDGLFYTIKSSIDISRLTQKEIRTITEILEKHYDTDGILIRAGAKLQLAVIKK